MSCLLSPASPPSPDTPGPPCHTTHLQTHKPHAIVVGASSPEATTLESDLRDIKESILLDNPRFMIGGGAGRVAGAGSGVGGGQGGVGGWWAGRAGS